MTSIDVHELTKEYGSTRAVDRLSFRVQPGRVTGFLGPNGAGKSTAMRLVLGLDRPTRGSATIGGRPYARLTEPLRTVGALLDAQAAHGSRTARSHVAALAASNGIPMSRVKAVLEETGLGDVGARRIKSFSLGMRQRLGIAVALLGDPHVVMLDEPSNGLDPEGIVWIRELMKRLAREGRTVLVSSHLMNETASFADHLVVLGRGRLLADMSMKQFLDSRTTPRVRLRTTEPSRLRSALASKGLTGVQADDGRWAIDGVTAAEIGAIAAGEGIPLLELGDERATLEQAYLDLTADDTPFAASTTRDRQEA
ncbi:ABC transporter ATP-binding protein [Streptomyces anulatus]|uniref:ABC transporter ATP-binding protein n=1 Tax=Streptomyces anulatus TaxID=1892 RepID=UPI0022563B07|nr:ATP-binding cassette domain-containing protein [Streptomyces anulatus]MCX4516876.1 ATP-binding cassette domain-containing protein [Streptomyces anulatus]MCX4599706.1 ATP-binding cassette domain-containing protein [Streptomyces anulatus]WSI76182.1 ATP-binding cassette domain-containing protein [Streptomyces anulatus]WSU72216.1 ATP-binding cassette domain-containing protein [Streptomyces anulatus]WTD08502.1 ATP-binding cassette domain-containing protein [Streptomyces anulatus]